MEMANNLVHIVRHCEAEHSGKVSSAERYVKELRAKSLKLEKKLVADTVSLESVQGERNRAENEQQGLAAELASIETILRARQARIQSLQADIAPLTHQLQELHTEEARLRDKFISDMQEQSSLIRKMHLEHDEAHLEQVLQAKLLEIQQRKEAKGIVAMDEERQESQVAEVTGEKGQEGLPAVPHEQPDESKRADLVEKLAKTKKALEAVSTEVMGLEEAFNFFRSELVRQTICPLCGSDNMEQMLDALAQSSARVA